MIAQLQGMPAEGLMESLEERGQLEGIRSDMKAEKTIEVLADQAKINEVEKSSKEDK